MKTCKDCRFHTKVDDMIGVCHRLPPMPVNETTSTQPPVKSAETWCGEYKIMVKPRK